MTKSHSTAGGVALWRQIADAIRLDIVGGKLANGDRLPTEALLSERFSANRHTVRRALAVLAEEGVVIAEQGRGTFVRSIRRLSYPIGKRTRFREGLKGQANTVVTNTLGDRIDNASAQVAEALGLKPGAKVVRLEAVSLADGVPLSRSTTWLAYRQFPDFAARLTELNSITRAFESYGFPDYVRATTRISARHADVEETRLLGLAPGAIVLVSEAVNADPDSNPLSYALSRFPAERMELVV
ncbi:MULTISPECIES: phosphonate metabolism transcriptional regulator PhnF [unclassified Devosia]|jgi:GntR family phosphonate transport system transcriptional regulator|uniref:phosphonate metabolism transcriptional regulator PhnF n=1 Tax=unclassified Devosia TaxID=196773 RepID=UPI0007126DC9|nr:MULTISPECIES: phosphonate metabolism transcriptional regulator PhnF [unclassified Devosia]KQN69680.1 phosphonate metabolism transcriptional regulator PhnF [Devosia sp. Leaf64]KQT45795.1 phosphonate metabolism transcriptional regulator PhnF [Devosia sp. Leaf420]